MSDMTLNQIEAKIQGALAADGMLGAAASHLAAGKRLRPRFLLSLAVLFGEPNDRALASAAAVELIHTASLLHDDVVDAADTRRGGASANARFGNAAAVLTGDFVLGRALSLLSFDARAVEAAIDAVTRMSEAAVREIEVRSKPTTTITLGEAINVAEGKTGALFALCGTLAGLSMHQRSEIGRSLSLAGRAFGVAFQIADDIHDVDEDKQQGARTVPLIVGVEAARALVEEHTSRARTLLTPFGGDAIVPASCLSGDARAA